MNELKLIEVSVIKRRDVTDKARLQSFRPPEELRFEVPDDPKVEGQLLILEGYLVNPTRSEVRVIVRSPYFNASLHEPGGGRLLASKPSALLQPPAPALPSELSIPARSRIRFQKRIDLAELEYHGAPTVELQWHFDYWGEAALWGRKKIQLPLMRPR